MDSAPIDTWNYLVLLIDKESKTIVSKVDPISTAPGGAVNGWPLPHVVPASNGHFTYASIRSLSGYNEVFEMDGQGSVVWRRQDIVFQQGPNWKDEWSPRMAAQMPNGHTWVSSPNGYGLPTRLLEFDGMGNIVRTLNFPDSFQPSVILPVGGNLFVVDQAWNNNRVVVLSGDGVSIAEVGPAAHGLRTIKYAYPLGANAFIYGMTSTGVNRLVEIGNYGSGSPTILWQMDIGLTHFFPLDENTILVANGPAHTMYVMDKTSGTHTWEFPSTAYPCSAQSAAESPCAPQLVYPISFTGTG